MRRPDVVTAIIFLDDVNDFNGPLLLIPGSNKAGLVDSDGNMDVMDPDNEWFNSYQQSTSYMSNLTANLKYTLKKFIMEKWVRKCGIHAAKGPVGTVVFFDGMVFHASSNILSPWNRNDYLVTYKPRLYTSCESG